MTIKYIVMGNTDMFTFPSHVDHREFANLLGGAGCCTSAGFIENTPLGLICRGESISLGIGSRPADTALLNVSLGL